MAQEQFSDSNVPQEHLDTLRASMMSRLQIGIWDEEARQACKAFIRGAKQAGTGDIVIANDLTTAGVDPREAWLMLGFLKVPEVASRRSMRSQRFSHLVGFLVLAGMAVCVCFRPITVQLDTMTLSTLALIVLFNWLRLERRARRSFQV